MFLTDAAGFIQIFIEDLNESLTRLRPDAQLTRLQKQWFRFWGLIIRWANHEKTRFRALSTACNPSVIFQVLKR